MHDFDSKSLVVKKRYPLTMKMLLSILGKTEANIREGLSLNDVLPILEAFRVESQGVQCYCHCIFRYDPEKTNHNVNIVCFALQGDNIYTLNHDLRQLARIAQVAEEGKPIPEINLTVSDQF